MEVLYILGFFILLAVLSSGSRDIDEGTVVVVTRSAPRGPGLFSFLFALLLISFVVAAFVPQIAGNLNGSF